MTLLAHRGGAKGKYRSILPLTFAVNIGFVSWRYRRQKTILPDRQIRIAQMFGVSHTAVQISLIRPSGARVAN